MSTISMTYNDENNCDCLGFKFKIGHETPPATKEPYQRIENTEVDTILVKGIMDLSFDELQREQDDLHGVSGDFIERSEEMDHVIGLMLTKLSKIKHGTAYEIAEAIGPSYISDRNFRMNFLRANRYDPVAAAGQMIRHFDLKLRLFGRYKLVKDIALSDLGDDDITPLTTGSYQISKVRDRTGRIILLKFPGLREYKSIENELRARFYFFTEMIKSLDSPNCGVVMVNYNMGHFRDKTNAHGLVENTKMYFAMPFFLAGVHLCFDRQSDIILGKAGLALAPPQVAARVKIHCGSHLECQYSLSSFGIPATVLPLAITETDSVLAYQLSWYQGCLEKETEDNHQGKPTPNENDVLCLGKKANSRGNERLLHMASIHQDWYNSGDAKQRKILVDLMIESIRKNGGRFLKPDESGLDLKELPVDEIREKIAQMFRNVKKRSRAHALNVASNEKREIVNAVYAIHKSDVLLGRKSDQPGNEKLRSLVYGLSGEYNSASRGRKKEIADSVVSEIKRTGGRFLKPADNGKWLEVSDKVAEMKVSSHFRNCRRVSKKQG